MRRHRDSKCRFIASKVTEKSRKPPKVTEKSRKTPHTNSINFYVGETLRGESSKEVIETTTKGPKSESTV